MHHVQFHRGLNAVNEVFSRSVEVKLQQFVRVAGDSDATVTGRDICPDGLFFAW